MVQTPPLRTPSPRKQRLGPMARQEERTAYLFLLPWLIGLVVFLIGPIVASMVLSLTDWNLLNPPNWVGLKNFDRMISDTKFRTSIGVTIKYTLMSVPLYMVAGLGLSLLLNQKLKGMNLFRTILYLPSVLAGVAVAVLWLTLLNPDLGAINQVSARDRGGQPAALACQPDWAVPAVVLMGLWGVGGGAIIYLAGLQNISPQLYEAAEIDGAGTSRNSSTSRSPCSRRRCFSCLITGLIGAFQVSTRLYYGRQPGRASGALNSTCSICGTRASATGGLATPRRWRGCLC